MKGILISFIFLSITAGYGQGNIPDPLVNLALTQDAIISGNAPEGGRGIPEDILWDPSTNDWATPSQHHEYGMGFEEIMWAKKDDPLYWQVVWTEAKNINYITCAGTYPNQPQPTTGWSVQILVDDDWQDLAKAHNGWDADTVRGVGVGIPTQTNWVWDGQLVWRGVEPVVTTGVRFTAYANPDSLADSLETFADSLWSFTWSGRDFGPGTPKAALIQYLDFSEEAADNKVDTLVNLALLNEAVVSADFQKWELIGTCNQPVDMLYDPVRDDYHNKNSYWGEFGHPWGYDAGCPAGPDSGFNFIIEWPVPKKINYFTWGGCYAGRPHPDTPWAFQYWDGEAWETLVEGVGGGTGWDWMTGEIDAPWPYTPGVDHSALSIWMVPEADAITTNKIRLAAWSNGIYPLYDFHFRCRGGASIYNDDSDIPFKAVLVQYAEITDPTGLGSEDLRQPTDFALHQNYPNPFNPVTVISWQLAVGSQVELSVYNLIGQRVATLVSEKQRTGLHQVEFNASGLASGIYYYQLKTEEYQELKKMVFVK